MPVKFFIELNPAYQQSLGRFEVGGSKQIERQEDPNGTVMRYPREMSEMNHKKKGFAGDAKAGFFLNINPCIGYEAALGFNPFVHRDEIKNQKPIVGNTEGETSTPVARSLQGHYPLFGSGENTYALRKSISFQFSNALVYNNPYAKPFFGVALELSRFQISFEQADREPVEENKLGVGVGPVFGLQWPLNERVGFVLSTSYKVFNKVEMNDIKTEQLSNGTKTVGNLKLTGYPRYWSLMMGLRINVG